MSCEHCGKEHAPSNLAEVAEDLLHWSCDATNGPKEGAAVLALTLGRLCEVYNVQLQPMLTLTRGSFEHSKTITESGPMPTRGTEWAC